MFLFLLYTNLSNVPKKSNNKKLRIQRLMVQNLSSKKSLLSRHLLANSVCTFLFVAKGVGVSIFDEDKKTPNAMRGRCWYNGCCCCGGGGGVEEKHDAVW